MTRLLVWVAWRLTLLHLAEIAVWALFYWWQKCLPDAESSFYFSGVTYTTVGYGDLVLPTRVAAARSDGGIDRHPDVRTVHWVLIFAVVSEILAHPSDRRIRTGLTAHPSRQRRAGDGGADVCAGRNANCPCRR